MSRTQSDLDSLHEEIGGCGLKLSGQERAHDGAAPANRFAGTRRLRRRFRCCLLMKPE